MTGRDSPLRKDPSWEDVLSTAAQRLLSHRLVRGVTQADPALGAQSSRGAEGLAAGAVRPSRTPTQGRANRSHVKTKEKVPTVGSPFSKRCEGLLLYSQTRKLRITGCTWECSGQCLGEGPHLQPPSELHPSLLQLWSHPLSDERPREGRRGPPPRELRGLCAVGRAGPGTQVDLQRTPGPQVRGLL